MNPLREAAWPPLDPERRRALATLFRGVAGAAVLGGLHGCGGGGASGDTPSPEPAPPPAPTPSPPPSAPLAAQMSVPTPVGYDADRLAAFDRLNGIRLSAGLGMLAQSPSLDQAAQAHAAWIIANDSFAHVETAGTRGFTGAHWWDRAEAAGYVPIEGEELMAGPTHGAAGVDALVNSVYHRAGILAFEPVDVGIGWAGGSAADVSMPLVLEVTRPGTDPARAVGQSAQASIAGVCVWPTDGAVDVPLRLGNESPNPVPTHDVATLGLPVSLITDEETTIVVESFVVSEATSGIALPGQILTGANDPNSLLPRSFVAFVPLAPLSAGTACRVDFTGTATGFLTGVQRAVQRSWTFTTTSA